MTKPPPMVRPGRRRARVRPRRRWRWCAPGTRAGPLVPFRRFAPLGSLTQRGPFFRRRDPRVLGLMDAWDACDARSDQVGKGMRGTPLWARADPYFKVVLRQYLVADAHSACTHPRQGPHPQAAPVIVIAVNVGTQLRRQCTERRSTQGQWITSSDASSRVNGRVPGSVQMTADWVPGW